ncbi:MAG TPA: carbohydrate kinase family protein [Streptosporangiaceae bacterium]|nr:carbohydrate kinase family protein [Streptosporangiaceae bacterium]
MLCSLGDLLLDVVVSSLAPGSWAHGSDTPSVTRVRAGGQAANVAAWAVALGGQARVVGQRAGDLAGELVAGDLARRGVGVAGPVGPGATGVVVAISEPGGERTMLTDRGVCPQLAAGELRDEWFDGCDWLHLPVYSLVDAPIRAAALAAARRVRRVSVDLSSVSVLREIGAAELASLLDTLAPEVIFGNEPECALVAPPPDITTLVTKLGAAGVRVNGKTWPARPAQPVDSTGAGDAFAAGFLVGGVEWGLEAAARAVSQLGAMP